MENTFPEKGTIEILRSSQPEFSDPRFNELLMKRIVDERNRKIRVGFWINYSLISISIGLIIFLVGRAFLTDPPVALENYDQAVGPAGYRFADYGYFVIPLVILVAFKKVFDARASLR